MKLSSRLMQYSLQAMLALPMLIAAQPAALAAPAAPVALTTLDVCHNELTGNWRYSGMVAVSGAAIKTSSVVGVDYWIQNSTSSAGYANALRVPGIAGPAILSPTITARVSRFSVEGVPLLVGTLRNSSQIVIADLFAPSTAPLQLQSGTDYTQAVCGCQHPKGCVRTQGYWKSKPGVVWPAPYSRTETNFFSSGLKWQPILETSPQGGNAYLILAHQYIAAVLNGAAGASAPASVQTVINNAATWFASGVNLDTCSGSDCETQKNWAAVLDTYNNGQYPGAPKHCPE
jgi:hypothetical protein